MTPKNILIGQAFVDFLIIGLAFTGATEFVAISFSFDHALERSWFIVGDWPREKHDRMEQEITVTRMDKLLSTSDVLSITGYRSRTTLWRKVRDQLFPRPVKVNGVTLRWREREVRDWIEGAPVQSYPAALRD